MLKQILTFSCVLLLCACATGRIKQEATAAHREKPVNFFVEGKTQAAFKVAGHLEGQTMEGVLTLKKTGEQQFEVNLLVSGLYRVLQATVTPEAVTYTYLFKEVDNSIVRGRITQLLDLLLTQPQSYIGTVAKKGIPQVRYRGPRAKEIFMFEDGAAYPYAARTVTTLNTAELSYSDYMPISAEGDVQVPHELVYKDGKVSLDLQLISLR